MSNKSPISINRLPWLGTGIGWTLLHAWGLHAYFDLSWVLAGWDAFLFNLWILSAALLVGAIITYLPKAGVFQMVIGLGMLLAFAAQWISHQALIRILPEEVDYLAFLTKSAPIRWIIGFVIITATGLTQVFYLRWRELAEAQVRQTDTQVLVREAELQKLQQQLQPHFLFNSLNSINGLILVQPDQAQHMVQQLSDFLRLTLKRADEPWVTLGQELEYLESYLAIERVRFGHRLTISLQVSDSARAFIIPTLVLQPLLENAIKFGLYGTTGKITIEMNAMELHNQLQIEITNPFDSDMQPPAGSGFGITGLQRRLYLLYARNDLMTTLSHESKFTVHLIIPRKP